MKISNNNKRSVGRPSLRTMTVRKGVKHATIVFSAKTSNDLEMIPGNKVLIKRFGDMFYICPNAKDGANIKTAVNGQGVKSHRISNKAFVYALLDSFQATNLAVLMIGATYKTVNGETYYPIINKPYKTDRI